MQAAQPIYVGAAACFLRSKAAHQNAITIAGAPIKAAQVKKVPFAAAELIVRLRLSMIMPLNGAVKRPGNCDAAASKAYCVAA